MLSKELFIALFLVFLVALLFGGISEGVEPIGEEGAGVFQTLIRPWESFVRWEGFGWIGPFAYPKFSFPWASAVWSAIWWDFPLFDNLPGNLVRYGLWAIFAIPLIFGLGMWVAQLLRGN